MEIIKLARLKLSGSANSPDAAENTFREISEKTGVTITWEEGRAYPHKKDPCLKLCGTPESVKKAKEMVLERMETQSNRIIMKMDVTHLEHPSLIGRGGKLVKQVMDETNTHIHFPDGNKNENGEKSNQVSISGEPQSVERARIMIRALIPVQIFFDVTLTSYNQSVLSPTTSCDIKSIENSFGLFIYAVPKREDVVTVVVRCSQGKFPSLRQNILLLMELLCRGNGSNLSNLPPLHLLIDITPRHQNFVKGERANNIHDIMNRTGAKILFPVSNSFAAESTVKISGTLDCVYMAWQEIMNFLPVCVSFDVTEMREIRGDYMDFLVHCGISVYSRPKPRFHVKSVTVKGPEKFSKQMLQYRQHLLQLQSLNFNSSTEESNLALRFLNSLDVQPFIQKAIPGCVSSIFLDNVQCPSVGQVGNGINLLSISKSNICQEQKIPLIVAPPPPTLGVLDIAGQCMQTKPQSKFECQIEAKNDELKRISSTSSAFCQQDKAISNSTPFSNTLKLNTWGRNFSVDNSNAQNVKCFNGDNTLQQSPLFASKQDREASLNCIAGPDINSCSGHSAYEKDAETIFSEIDYYRKKLMAAKAMRRPIESERSTQVPSSVWAGYGFSQSMPASVIRDGIEMFNHYSSPSLESCSSGSSEDTNSWENIVFKDYLGGSIWSSKKEEMFSHSNYFDFLRGTPINIGCATKDVLPELLSRHGLHNYINTFTREEIDYQAFLLLTDDDLRNLGIRNPAKGIMISLIRGLRDIEFVKEKPFDATPGAGRRSESSF